MLCHRTGRRGVAWLVCLPLLVACISRVAPTPVALSPRPPSASASSGPGSETPSTSPLPAASEGEDPATIFSRVSPSVVFVGTPIGTGSGVVLDPRHVITNAHVVRPYAEARLVDATGEELGTAKVVGFDLLADLAVLASDAPLDAPAMRIGDPADLAVGDRVFLVGFPGVDPDAPEPTITEGIITSAPLEWHDGLTFHDSDAEIGSGQSGGALVDAAGRLIGISGASRGDLSVSLDVADVLDRAGRIVRGEDVDGLPDRLLPSPANGSLEVRARVASRADAHAWVVDGHQGGPAATVALTADGGDVGLYALAAGGELANSAGRPGRSLQVELDFQPPGPYLIKVESRDSVPIEVAITSTIGLTPVQDPDDGPVLEPGDVHLGVADYAGDLDWFTVSLAKGDRIRVVAAAAGFDAALYLDDVRTGETVGFGVDSGGPMGADDVLRFMAPRAGEYRIVLSDIRSFGFGGYRLELIPG